MPSASVLTSDVQAFSFKNIDFNAQVLDWGDVRKPRIAFHEYLKRDGGTAEYMGRSPHVTRLNLVYIGPNWRKDLLVLQSSIDDYPIGTLTHAFYGSMNVACLGVEESKVNLDDGINAVLVPISFRESNLDQRLTRPETQQGPAYKQGQVTIYTSLLSKAAALYLAASAAVSVFNQLAQAYAVAATNTTLSTGGPDPTLDKQLANVVIAAKTARDAIRSDPAATDDVQTYSAITSIELALDACNQIADAVKQVRPVLSPWQVPATTPLLSIAQFFYGKDAATRMDEIRANNIGKIPNPAAVQGGTMLLMAPSTVRTY